MAAGGGADDVVGGKGCNSGPTPKKCTHILRKYSIYNHTCYYISVITSDRTDDMIK